MVSMKQVCVVRLCNRGPKSSFSPNLGVRRTVTVANTTHAMDITLFDDHVQSCPFVNGEAVMSFVDVRVEEWAGVVVACCRARAARQLPAPK